MRKIGIILAVLIIILAVLVAIGALALPRLIDMNAYKGSIQSLVKSATGKDVETGTIGIRVWKGIEVYATDIQVKDKRENLVQTVLKAEKISAKLAFWPLLRKKLRINSIIVHSPEVDYSIGEEHPFSSLLLLSNIGALVGQGTRDLPMKDSEPEKKSSFFSDFSFDPAGLGRVEIKRGAIKMQKKLTSGDLLSLVLDKVYVNTNPSRVPPSLFIDAKGSFPENAGELKIHGTFGNLEEEKRMPLQIFIEADIIQSRIFSKHLLLLTGIGVDRGRINMKTEINGSLGEKINIHSEGTFEDLLLEGSAARIYQDRPIKGTFTFKGNVEHSILDLEEVRIHIGQSVIRIGGTVDLKDANPMLRFSIQGNAINYSEIRDLAPLFQIHLPSYIKGGTLQADLRGKAKLGSFSIKEVSGESVLDDFVIEAESLPARIENIHCRMKISAHALDLISINAHLQENPIDGTMRITDFTAPESTFDLKVMGGRATGKLAFPKQEERDYLLRMEVEEIDMSSFIATLFPAYHDIIHGKLAGKMQVKSPELMTENVLLRAEGSGNFHVKEGKITTFGLLEQVGLILNVMGGKGIGKEETPFESLEGQFHLKQGDLKIKNLLLKAPDLTLRGDGVMEHDLRIDFSFQARFSRDVSQAMVASTPLLKYRVDSNGRLSFPLEVGGNINQPKVSLDLNKILEKSTKKKIFDKIKNFLNR